MPRKPQKIQIRKEIDKLDMDDFERDIKDLIPLLQSIQEDAISKGFDGATIDHYEHYYYGDDTPYNKFIVYAYREETDQERDDRVRKDKDLKKQRMKEIKEQELKQLEKLTKKYGKSN